ncbi:MAG: YggS family pyridoxal phosphate-dependent enzyme [Defluviitaleaceae bacterium]|nr:YggS family pyridoxal phosphate-dependent enzyme [Defluviitaleaceae bacterium]
MKTINENVAAIRAMIADSAKKSGRDPNEIKLIGVTKSVDVSRINELIEAGVTIIGENRVQEFLPKYEFFSDKKIRPTEFHFIGHLQKNKVKFIVDKVDLIHSVDSLSLAEEINKRGEQIGKVINFLAEINISGESSKFGMPPDEILNFAKNVVNMRFLRLSGLMCVAPFVKNPSANRVNFARMKNLLLDIETICKYNCANLELSMGMSSDFSVAIEEGATMIRIGTALFNER